MTTTPYPTTWPCPVHEAAELFPLIDNRQVFAALVADIKRQGLLEPIWLTVDGKLLDGRNRFRACLQAGVVPKFQTFRGPGTAFKFVISKNLHRRHLTTSQRAMIAAKIAKLEQGARTDLAQNRAMSQVEASEALNVSRTSTQTAKKVLETGTPELTKAVDDGAIGLNVASEVAELPQEAQREVVTKVKKGAKPSTVMPKKKAKPHNGAPAMPDIPDQTSSEVQTAVNDLCANVEYFAVDIHRSLEEIRRGCTEADFDDVKETLERQGREVSELAEHFEEVLEEVLEEVMDRLFDGHLVIGKVAAQSDTDAPADPAPSSKRRKK